MTGYGREEVEAAAARAAAATPGPWKCWSGWGPISGGPLEGMMAMTRISSECYEGGITAGGSGSDFYATREDAEFVAMASVDVPALADTALSLMDEVRAWDELLSSAFFALSEAVADGDYPANHPVRSTLADIRDARRALAATDTEEAG